MQLSKPLGINLAAVSRCDSLLKCSREQGGIKSNQDAINNDFTQLSFFVCADNENLEIFPQLPIKAKPMTSHLNINAFSNSFYHLGKMVGWSFRHEHSFLTLDGDWDRIELLPREYDEQRSHRSLGDLL
jgi:hypothetical protein